MLLAQQNTHTALTQVTLLVFYTHTSSWLWKNGNFEEDEEIRKNDGDDDRY
jgi:hypothetical protein